MEKVNIAFAKNVFFKLSFLLFVFSLGNKFLGLIRINLFEVSSFIAVSVLIAFCCLPNSRKTTKHKLKKNLNYYNLKKETYYFISKICNWLILGFNST
jgi:hypothetical protein